MCITINASQSDNSHSPTGAQMHMYVFRSLSVCTGKLPLAALHIYVCVPEPECSNGHIIKAV